MKKVTFSMERKLFEMRFDIESPTQSMARSVKSLINVQSNVVGQMLQIAGLKSMNSVVTFQHYFIGYPITL